MRIIKGLLIGAMVILIVMSTLALFAIHWELSKKTFSFSPRGIDNYLRTLGSYKTLFTATIATIAAYFGLHRLKAAVDANLQKLQQDRFAEWRSVLDVSLVRIEGTDNYMKREFIRSRYKLFQRLFPINFAIGSKSQLESIFDEIFRDSVYTFEEQNKNYIKIGGLYLNQEHSYSFDSFRYLFISCLDTCYIDLESDLKNLYLERLPNRLIDPEGYRLTKIANTPPND